jgi:hypothetical protein
MQRSSYLKRHPYGIRIFCMLVMFYSAQRLVSLPHFVAIQGKICSPIVDHSCLKLVRLH